MSAIDEYKKSKTAFQAIPGGTYDVTIAKAEVIPFANSGPYAGKKALNVQLRIIDTAEVGAKRVFFFRVPLFDRFLPNQKNPQGAIAFGYFQFAEAIGLPEAQQVDGFVPEFHTFLGKQIAAAIKFFPIGSPQQEYHLNKETGEPEAWNEVNSVYPARKAKGGTSIPGIPAAISASAPPENPWATAAPAEPTPAVAEANPWLSTPAEANAAVTPTVPQGWAPDPALAAAVGATSGF